METLIQDLRYAVRTLMRMRGAAVVAVLTLALGVGATTMVFSIVYAALLRPLPFTDPDGLVLLYVTRTSQRDGLQRMRWSYPEITALGSTMTSLEDVASFTQSRVNLTSNGDPEQIFGEVVTPSYLRILRVSPQAGRNFVAEENTVPGGHPVAIISARLWQRRFASDPAIVGRSIGINRVPLTIVGVLPAAFSGLSGRAELWIPTTMAPQLTYADYLTTPQHFVNLIGRLRPGASIEHAAAELETIGSRVVVAERSREDGTGTWSATLGPLANARIDASNRRSGLLLLTAVTCVLLIACVNVASVLLARARARRREIAVRLAIGAGRARIVRQLLTESLVLAVIGGGCGTLLAMWSVTVVSLPEVVASARNGYAQIGAFAAPAVDRTVLLFALAITIGTSVLFGLAPALDISRADLVTAMKEDERCVAGGPRRLLAALVVSEVALAVLLLAGAGLLLKSFASMQELRAGFTPDRVLTFWISPPVSQYTPADGPAIVERLLTSIQRAPGVASAAVNRCTPFATSCARTILFFADRPANAAHAPTIGRHYVSADYFRTLGIPLRTGRTLTDDDRAGRPPVAVINETAARRFWPGENAIGKRVWFGSTTGSAFASREHPVEVVGVVGDVKYGSVEESVGPDFYTSYLQFSYPDTMVVVKADRDVSAIVPAMRTAVSSVDAGLPIYDVQTLDERIWSSLSRPRFNAAVLAVFAGAALLLAAAGVYGVMTYSVSLRFHEIGVRLALGAGARRVLALVLGEAARLAGAGAAVGLLAAFGVTRFMRSILFGVAPTDPLILTGAALVIITVALIAAVLPARRAGAVDPVIVLRSE